LERRPRLWGIGGAGPDRCGIASSGRNLLRNRWLGVALWPPPFARSSAKRHGPYFELTYKANGKTVNVKLSPEAAPLYRAAAQHYRKLKTLLKRLDKHLLALVALTSPPTAKGDSSRVRLVFGAEGLCGPRWYRRAGRRAGLVVGAGQSPRGNIPGVYSEAPYAATGSIAAFAPAFLGPLAAVFMAVFHWPLGARE
jgi:hypothetical protein